MAISKKSWTGVVVESPAGTAGTTPTVFTPCKSKAQRKTKYVYVTEDRGGRDANTKRLGTVRMSQLDITGSWYNDTSPYFLLGFMGQDTATQPNAADAPTVYSHAMALVDTPPAMTVFKGFDVAGYYFAYSAVEKLKFTFAADGKLLDFESSLQSQYPVKVGASAFSAMTPSYSSVNLFAGYVPTIQLNGANSTNVEEMTVELEQKLTLYYAINGSRAFTKVYYGDRSGKVSFTASFDDTSLVDAFDQEADQHINIAFAGDYLLNQRSVAIPGGSTAGNFTLTVVNPVTGVSATTGNIAWNATNTAVQTALEALTSVGLGVGKVTVTGGPGPSTAWKVKFASTAANVGFTVTGTGTGLTPSGSVTVTDQSLKQSFVMDFPIVGLDDAEVAVDKEYIQVKAAGTARPGTAINSMMTATVQNAVASYAL